MLKPANKPMLVVGGGSGKTLAARSLFTPCASLSSLVKAVAEAAKNATSCDAVLLSPTGSSFGQFRNHQPRTESFCRAVKSIGRGVHGGIPKIQRDWLGDSDNAVGQRSRRREEFAAGFFEGKPRGEMN
jgi:hypothetical protein